MSTKARQSIRPRDCRSGDFRQLPEAQPGPHVEEPGDVRHRGGGGGHDPRSGLHQAFGSGVRLADLDLVVVHGDLRELRRGHGRRPRQGPGRNAAQEPHQDPCQAAQSGRLVHLAGGGIAAERRRVRRGGRRDDCRRRRDHRRRRHDRRIGHHRRIGPRDPRGRRRPLGRHRRHQGALRRDHGPRDRQPRRVVHGPHDRTDRRGQTPEDAQRNRPVDPALGADDHLPGGRRHDDAVRTFHAHLSRRQPGLRAGQPGLLGHGPGFAAGLPDSDHDRRIALGHRHRRHRPHGAEERAGHERPRGGSRRRRGRAAAGQDRHDHDGQPPGDGIHPRPRRRSQGTGRGRAACQPGRRNAGRPQHRDPGQGAVRHPRPGNPPDAARRLRALHRADAHERRGYQRPLDSQGRRRQRPQLDLAERIPRKSTRPSIASAASAERRWWWPVRTRPWA